MSCLQQIPNPPAGILFDFDGVLVDSLPVHLAAWSAATKAVYGQPLAEPERITSLATVNIAQMIDKEMGQRGKSTELMEKKQQLLASDKFEVPLLPGARELIAWLRREKIPHGIASNAPGKFVRSLAEHHCLGVQVVLGRGEGGRNKPHPDIYLKCAQLAGLKLAQHKSVLIFEDSLHGLKAAAKAGMIPLGICSQHDRETLIKGGAKAAFEDLKDFRQQMQLC